MNKRGKDISIAKHQYWLMMKEAGVLRNGHVPSGKRIEDSKADLDKKICRKKIDIAKDDW